MIRQAFIQKREVGINDVARRKIPYEQFFHEQTCFLDGGKFQRVVQLIVVIQSRGRRSVIDLPQVEPLISEAFNKSGELRIIEQTIRLRF